MVKKINGDTAIHLASSKYRDVLETNWFEANRIGLKQTCMDHINSDMGEYCGVIGPSNPSCRNYIGAIPHIPRPSPTPAYKNIAIYT